MCVSTDSLNAELYLLPTTRNRCCSPPPPVHIIVDNSSLFEFLTYYTYFIMLSWRYAVHSLTSNSWLHGFGLCLWRTLLHNPCYACMHSSPSPPQPPLTHFYEARNPLEQVSMMVSFRYQKKRMFFEHISVLIADSGSGICGLSSPFFRCRWTTTFYCYYCYCGWGACEVM